jgi:acyl transferase domain-containing protein/acyl carrier protein
VSTEARLREYLNQATEELRKARRQADRARYREHGPIAIVSAACRYPGQVRTTLGLWRLALEGRDAITPLPEDRGWDIAGSYDPDPDRPGTNYSRAGGFLDGFADFDAEFFDISPREALAMDPQQRHVLEVAWEAVELAGIDPTSLRGSRTGVYLGACETNYDTWHAPSAATVEGLLATGSYASVISGRVAYTLGLEGPAITLDTACSSSLVATHLAAHSLRWGECDLALAGGVTVMCSPRVFLEFSRQRALAPDGRCKAFSQHADGFGFAEGVGILALARLEDAQRLHYPILAVIRGSAVNSDGRSNGLSAPNGPAQERVIRAALADAGLDPAEVDAVEAHGTGTPLGDPIEAGALLATYGQGRAAGQPLLFGSVKSNIGHTQAAAGVAGVLKALGTLETGVLPGTLHLAEPSAAVDWASGAAEPAPGPVELPDTGRPRRVAVSSFGISGTNAHVVLEQAPEVADAPRSTSPDVPVLLSARGEAALRAQARQLRDLLDSEPDVRPVDLGHALLTTRATFEHRAAVLGDRASVRQGLATLAAGGTGPNLVQAAATNRPRTVFVFPGQGTQWPGMAAGLLASTPAFRASVEECDAALAPHLGWSVLEALLDSSGRRLERDEEIQPALFTVMVALAQLWREHGVRPDVVVGHSQGELAAAHVCGALRLDDAALIVAERARAVSRLHGTGGMASLWLSHSQARDLLAPWDGVLSVAAVNGPGSVVISGASAGLDELLETCAEKGIRARRLPVGYGAHSALIDPLEGPLGAALATVTPTEAAVPLCSTVTGDLIRHTELDAGYWYRNLRARVRFSDAIRTLLDQGNTIFLEVSPHPVLTAAIEEIAVASHPAVALGTLRRDDGGPSVFGRALAEAHVHGVPVDWPRGTGTRVRLPMGLPTYPFQRRRYWLAPGQPEHRDATPDATESRFWRAVESQDLPALASELGVEANDPLAAVLPAMARWRTGRRANAEAAALRYRVTWREISPVGSIGGHWLLVAPTSASGDAVIPGVARALSDGGAGVRRVAVDAGAVSRAEIASAVRGALAGDTLDGVLCFLALDTRVDDAAPAGLAGTIVLLHGLADADVTAPFWLATVGAVSTGHDDKLDNPLQATAWGLGAVAALEQPGRWGGLVDLPAVLDDRTRAGLRSALGSGEDQLAVRASGVFARRLVHAPTQLAPRRWTASGPVLVTGGTGALGAEVARGLARAGAPRLVLASRRGPAAPGATDLAAELTGLGAATTVLACDVTDRAALAALLAEHPVTAVVHTAGVLDDRLLHELSPGDLAGALRPKLAGALALHELTSDRELDAFVLFSSFSGVVGRAGQATYGAANAFLDALAHHRRGRGLPATSIAWGRWAGGLAAAPAIQAALQRDGLGAMAPEAALTALWHAVAGEDPCPLIARVDWTRFLSRHSPATGSLLRDLPEAACATIDIPAIRERLDRLGGVQGDRLLLDLVRRETDAVLLRDNLEPAGADRSFASLGFDSLTALQLRNRVAAATGLTLPTGLVFDHPTPRDLARYLHAQLTGMGTATPTPVPTEARTGDLVAIVGMACHFPGGIDNPDQLWRLLLDERDVITGFPTDRGWQLDRLYHPDPSTPRRSYVAHGGFLSDAGGFDAAFFGISPREALAMDPQQRLLLETAWETLEHANINPHSLRGSRTGVFVGTNGQDYASTSDAVADGAEQLGGYLLTGTAASVVSGRLAYVLGLEGPALTVDTACSSSLVATHLAVQALRRGECDLALAGGVSVMAQPGLFVEFSRQRGLAPDGRCKPFAAAADGTAWSEGAALVLLEPLALARRRGHRVHAVIRGSAVNSDGASNGLSAPSGTAQKRVMAQALADAGLATSDIDVLEAHGTGTTLGDPIEAQAILDTYGRGRRVGQPLLLGAIKSNLGHTQAAAGAAGLIKATQAITHAIVPRSLHVDRPTGHVDWSDGTVVLSTGTTPWPENGHPRRAAISSFGISGTNAHLVLEEPPPAPVEPCSPSGVRELPWLLSAHSAEALSAQADRLRDHLVAHPELASDDVAYTLATARAHLPYRAVISGDDREERLANLTRPAVHQAPDTPKCAFLFPGQGSQRAGAGKQLHASYPAYADALDAVCAEFDSHLDTPLRDVLFAAPGTEAADLLDQTGYTQPALFATQVALSRLLESWGVVPDLLLGHSIGELAAAHVSGVWSLPEACRLVAARGRLMQSLPAGGAMLAVEATEDEGQPWLGEYGVSVASVNGPRALVLSGPEQALDRLACNITDGHRVRRLRVSHAFHSAQMDAILTELTEAAASVDYQPPRIPLVSNVTGTLAGDELHTPGYWAEQARRTVRFQDGARYLLGAGVSVFLELGRDGALATMVRSCADETHDPVAIPALPGQLPEPEALLDAIASTHLHGVSPRWDEVFAGTSGRHVPLPTYAFQHRRYWLERSGADPATLGQRPVAHPLLASAVSLADGGGLVFTGHLDTGTQPWLADHTIAGTTLLPATAFLEIVRHAGAYAGCARVEELSIGAALPIPGAGGIDVQLTVREPDADGRRPFTVHSRESDETPWTQHASGTLGASAAAPTERLEWPPPGAQPVDADEVHSGLDARGYAYGPTFGGLEAAWQDGEALFAEVTLPDAVRGEATRYGLHPALLDAALQLLGHTSADGGPLLPFTISGFAVFAPGAETLRVRLSAVGENTVSILAEDDTGQPVAVVESLTMRPIPGTDDVPGLLRVAWLPLPAGHPGSAPLDVTGIDPGTITGSPELAVVRVGSSGADPAAIRETLASTLTLLRRWLAVEHLASSRLAFVTRGVVAVSEEEDVTNLAGAAVWGLVRSAQTEHPGRFVLADLGSSTADSLLIAGDEPQVAIRDGAVFVPRLRHPDNGDTLTPPVDGLWRLDVTSRGELSNLALLPEQPQPLGPGQVRIAARAAGLNFRDVLLALGVYPGEAPMGSEVAGVVVDVAPDVSRFSPGDRVLGLAGRTFGQVVTTDHRMLAKIPDGWTMPQAASIPIVFLTAYQALSRLARLRDGQSVLIHAGVGGVGMAAIQVARHLGAEVYATASPSKHDVLRAMGLDDDHIASSRTVDFETRFRARTGARGVDVVLNSLAGEFIDASLRLLAPGGRFIELGKTDRRQPVGVDYHLFDLSDVPAAEIERLLPDVLGLFERGTFTLLPIKTWDIRRAPRAFRRMSQARHTGKIVLTIPRAANPDGTVLITGGTGALGASLARHLIARDGVRHLLLLSRRGTDAPGAAELRAELTEAGATVDIVACDAADRVALADAIAQIPPAHPLTAVVHAAGVLDDGAITSVTPGQLDRVCRPKVDAAITLDDLTAQLDLAEFVLCSSVSGLIGGPGQGVYASANTVLDALAKQRVQRGLPARSLLWGPWTATEGMTATLDKTGLRRILATFRPLTPERGCALFDAARALPDAVVVAAQVTPRASGTVFDGLGHPGAPAPTWAVQRGQRRESTDSPPRRDSMLNMVRTETARVLGLDGPAAVAPNAPFRGQGFDSLTSLELRNRLAAATGLKLPPTLVFDLPTPAAVAADLLARLTGAPDRTARPAPATPRQGEPIAIVGMGCHFPGGIDHPDQLWRLLLDERDVITGFPDDRGWPIDQLYDPDPDVPGKTHVTRGGFLAGATGFDAAFFGIGSREALAMDPQQRLLLETAWETLEHANIDPHSLRGSRTGVFAGATDQGYRRRLPEVADDLELYLAAGTLTSVVSGRVAYALGLEGPAITIDTACSSALVAVHLAVQALHRGECDLALAGGVAIMAGPDGFVTFSRERGLAPDGHCKPFAEAADGTAWSEGAALVLVEPLALAQRRGHRVHAVIRGSAVNSDGASNGLSAPSGPAQQRVITQALADAGLSASDIDVLEAHGTGTTLGDPIEANAVLGTYGTGHTADRPLLLGSVKANLGHTQAAAGAAGLIKTVLALTHGTVPKTPGIERPTPHVDWSEGTVTLATRTAPWPETGRPRRAAISSFGLSGTNAHLIVEQPPTAAEAADEPTEPEALVPWVLSAHNPEALRAQADRLREHLTRHPELGATDIGYTLATARAHLPYRAAFTGRTPDEPRERLGKPTVHHAPEAAKVAFLFPGQGTQYAGMGTELMAACPVFAERMRECSDALAEYVDWRLST